jgi:hypothetical protein
MKAFAVFHPDYNGVVYLHAETRSKARYKVWLMAREYYTWTMMNLESQHVKALDDQPINANTLLGIAREEDRYQRSCLCEICRPKNIAPENPEGI